MRQYYRLMTHGDPERPERPEYNVYRGGSGGRSRGRRAEQPPARRLPGRRAGERADTEEGSGYTVYKARRGFKRPGSGRPRRLRDRFRRGDGGTRGRPARSRSGAASLKWAALALGAWLLLSLVLFVVSAQIQKGKLDDAAGDALGGFPLLVASGQTILVMGTDARPEGSDEGGRRDRPEVPGEGGDRRGDRERLRRPVARRHADARPRRRRRLREALDPPRHVRRRSPARARRRSTPPTRSAAPSSRSRRSRTSSASTSTTS